MLHRNCRDIRFYCSIRSCPAYVFLTGVFILGHHCCSSEHSLLFKYMFMICLLPYWIFFLLKSMLILPVPNRQLLNPHSKVIVFALQQYLLIISLHGKTSIWFPKHVHPSVYIRTAFLFHHTRFVMKKLALFTCFPVFFYTIRNNMFKYWIPGKIICFPCYSSCLSFPSLR